VKTYEASNSQVQKILGLFEDRGIEVKDSMVMDFGSPDIETQPMTVTVAPCTVILLEDLNFIAGATTAQNISVQVGEDGCMVLVIDLPGGTVSGK
jgi:hypothetical protein